MRRLVLLGLSLLLSSVSAGAQERHPPKSFDVAALFALPSGGSFGKGGGALFEALFPGSDFVLLGPQVMAFASKSSEDEVLAWLPVHAMVHYRIQTDPKLMFFVEAGTGLTPIIGPHQTAVVWSKSLGLGLLKDQPEGGWSPSFAFRYYEARCSDSGPCYEPSPRFFLFTVGLYRRGKVYD